MPPIETLDEWNAMLSECGCCTMPSCPTPEVKYQRRDSASTSSAVYVEASPNWTAWKKRSQRLWTSWNPSLPAVGIGSNIIYQKENREQIQVPEFPDPGAMKWMRAVNVVVLVTADVPGDAQVAPV